MKLIVLTSLFIACYSIVMGQITLTQSDFPDAQDTLVSSQAISFQIDYASTGPNYTWDFSNLSFSNQITRIYQPLAGTPLLVNMAYGPFAVTAYRSSYYAPYLDLPLAQIGQILPIEIGDVNQYTKKSAPRLSYVGYSLSISGQGVPMKSDTIETKYYFPLDYGADYTTKGYTYFDLSMFIDAQWMQKRKRHTVVDGWGSITTPYGTFDVLRVQHRVEETDSIGYTGTVFGLDIPVTYEYEWIAKNEKTPILRITTSELMGNETVVSIEYKDYDFLSIESLATDKLIVYPNPATNELNLSWKLGRKNVKIYQLDGTLVSDFSFDEKVEKFNISDLASGMYFLSIECEGESSTTSFIKE